MTTTGAIAVSAEVSETHRALVAQITAANLVPVGDIQVLVSVVETHNAQLHRMLEIIEEFDLSARDVATLYETRDAFGSKDDARPSLAALARTGAAFSEFTSGDPDDLATDLIEACRQVQRRWPTKTLYPDMILSNLIAVGAEDGMSFAQACDFLINAPTVGIDEDGEVEFYGD